MERQKLLKEENARLVLECEQLKAHIAKLENTIETTGQALVHYHQTQQNPYYNSCAHQYRMVMVMFDETQCWNLIDTKGWFLHDADIDKEHPMIYCHTYYVQGESGGKTSVCAYRCDKCGDTQPVSIFDITSEVDAGWDNETFDDIEFSKSKRTHTISHPKPNFLDDLIKHEDNE